jgi:hypothetical protein
MYDLFLTFKKIFKEEDRLISLINLLFSSLLASLVHYKIRSANLSAKSCLTSAIMCSLLYE